MQEISNRNPDEQPPVDKAKSMGKAESEFQAKDKCLTEVQGLQRAAPDKSKPLSKPPDPNWLDLNNIFAQSAIPKPARDESLKEGGATLQSTNKEGDQTFVYPDGRRVIKNKTGTTGQITYPIDLQADPELAGFHRIEHFGLKAEDNFVAHVKPTASGGWLYKYDNGALAYTNKDGSAGKRVEPLDKDGSFTVRHWGPKEKDNYQMKYNADGTIVKTTKGQAETIKGDSQLSADNKPEWTKVAASRAKLEIYLAAQGHDNKRLNEILNSIEKRCKENNGLTVPSPQNLVKAYDSATSILSKPGVGVFKDQHLKDKLVLEGLRNLSDTTGIDQGHQIASEPRPGSCGETNAEKFIAQRDAAAYFKALQEVAQTGKAKVGKMLLAPTDVKPGFEEAHWSIYNEGGSFKVNNYIYQQDGNRNMASKVIQNLCLAYAIQENGKALNGVNHINIENFTKAMTGTAMTTVGPTGIDKSPNKIHAYLDDTIANKLKAEGKLPALVFQGYHWTSVHDVKQVQCIDSRTNHKITRTQVYWDNQYGRKGDRGWVYPECIR